MGGNDSWIYVANNFAQNFWFQIQEDCDCFCLQRTQSDIRNLNTGPFVARRITLKYNRKWVSKPQILICHRVYVFEILEIDSQSPQKITSRLTSLVFEAVFFLGCFPLFLEKLYVNTKWISPSNDTDISYVQGFFSPECRNIPLTSRLN